MAAVVLSALAGLVDTRIGTRVGAGSALIGPCVPHGSVAPGPDTMFPCEGRRFPSPSGYYPGDPVVGFSQLHCEGTGGTPTYGLFLVSPTLEPGESEEDLASPMIVHEARPHRLRCRFDRWRTEVEVAPTAHGAVYRFDFPETNAARLVINVRRKIGARDCSADAVLARDAATGACWGGGTYSGNWNPSPYGCWFYAKETVRGRRRELRLAVSFRSVERAKAHYEAELDGRSLESVADAAEALWDEKLSRVRVAGLDAAVACRFYSHLAHAFIQPRDRSGDFDGLAAPVWDDHYTLWDTWKTLFPLLSIIDPQTVAGCVDSFSARAKELGYVPSAFIQGRAYSVGQGGDEADNVIADAFARGVTGFDREAAWRAVAANAARRTADYLEKGYVAADVRHPDRCWRMLSGSGTTAFAFNDWCAAEVAARTGHVREAEALRRRAASWTNVWDASACDSPGGFSGFIRARRDDGTFAATDRRKGYNTDFYEGTCWEYSFAAAPHDVDGLVTRMGGREAFVRRLEYALGNDLIDFGNEPSFMTPWLFDFVGRMDLASKWAARLFARFPSDGSPGDDDSGAMGALYVFLSAGLFPIAGTDQYALHLPLAPEVSFTSPETGRVFSIRKTGDVRPETAAAWLNGRRLERPFVSQSDIRSGGELVFRSGSACVPH